MEANAAALNGSNIGDMLPMQTLLPAQQKPETQQDQPPVQEESIPSPAPSPMPEPLPSPEVDQGVLTMIGDSVMLGAALELQEQFPQAVIDAKEGRQVWDAPKLIKQLDSQGLLAERVLIALGANGTPSAETGQQIMDALGTDRQVYWVLPYGKYLSWQEDCCDALRELADSYPYLHLLDWPTYADGQTAWFYNDGMHLTAQGKTEYAQFIAQGLAG